MEHALEVRDLNVSYRNIQSFSIKRNLFNRKKAPVNTIHAVRDVSFNAEKGEVIGIVGKNGSGKSTLLSTIAGVFAPDSGTVDLKGNTVSLLSLGTGFNNEVSGRENIFLNGLLLGFSEEQIDERLEEIIEFSELGEFVDLPVRSYSSGMRSKLAFSITVALDTDIILVDEVLSVGDTKFRKKSYKKMKELISSSDRTVLIVSHQENTLKELCSRILWLQDGSIVMMDNAETVLDAYTEFMK